MMLKYILILFPGFLFSQQWVDTLYSIETELDIPYGNAVDFAGNDRALSLDISYPSNDEIPECGRPLLVMVHGGAFISGDKNTGYPKRIREDFAKRGYTTASVKYRLGMFQTHQEINCNISSLGLEWNCLNFADTSEWYRAYYRGIQDVNGAIRYLVNNAETYGINPDNIFIVGESAGGFIAMGAGFIDHESETLASLTAELSDVQAPNQIYEAPCIQHETYDLDTSIASMNLSRPDLGPYPGSLNQPVNKEFQIKGVGNIYGAVFNNIFLSTENDIPALYLFHQPADLIVPYVSGKVLAGFAECAAQFGCQYIVNRPMVYGSAGIKNMLDDLEDENMMIPDYYFDNTSNNANCAQQIFDSNLAGHAFDNYWLRTQNMATFFAAKIDSCLISNSAELSLTNSSFKVFPNPCSSETGFLIKGNFKAGDSCLLIDRNGLIRFERKINNAFSTEINFSSSQLHLEKGIYFVQIKTGSNAEVHKLIVY